MRHPRTYFLEPRDNDPPSGPLKAYFPSARLLGLGENAWAIPGAVE